MKAKLAAAATVLLWASAFPAIAVADRGLGPAGLAVARLVVASAALAVVAPFLGVRRPRVRDLPLIALCGLAGMTGDQLLLNAGERVVPAGTASLLVATAPVYASVLAAMFLGERPAGRWWAGSAVALAGTAVIAVSHGLGFGASALVVLAAAVLQGIFHTAQKRCWPGTPPSRSRRTPCGPGRCSSCPGPDPCCGPCPTRGRPRSARPPSWAWHRRPSGSCCGATRWRGCPSGG